MKSISTLLLALSLVLSAPAAVPPAENANDLFQQALSKERTEGNLPAAIKLYQHIVDRFAANRKVAAQALLQMAECYQKLGDSQSRRTYEQVLHDYADQSAQANEARVRLAALEHNGPVSHEMVMRRILSGRDVDDEGAPTPDGKYLTYADWSTGTGDLAARDLVTGTVRRLTHNGTLKESDEFSESSIPSPDGKRVAYAWYNKDNFYELRVIGMDGSGARAIYRNPAMFDVEPKAWMPDGKRILVGLEPKPRGGGWEIALVSVADGSVQVLKRYQRGNPRDQTVVPGCISPDGQFIAYSAPKPGDESHAGIDLLSTDGTQNLPVFGWLPDYVFDSLLEGTTTEDVSVVTYQGNNYFLGWAPDGTTMVFANDHTGSLGAYAVPIAGGKAQGSPRLLRQDIGAIKPLGFTRGGDFYYGLKDTFGDFVTAKVDFASGKVSTPPTPVSLEFAMAVPVFSPDGNYLAYLSVRHHPRTGPASGWRADTLVIRNVATGVERELVPPKLSRLWGIALWFPNGQSLLLGATDQQGRGGRFQVNLQTGEASLLLQNDPNARYDSPLLTPDQKSLVYIKYLLNKGTGLQIMIRDIESGAERALLDSQQDIRGIAVSPDGREIAFVTGSNTAGAAALKIVRLTGEEPRTLYSPTKGFFTYGNALTWTPDGKRIVFGVVAEGMSHTVNLWGIAADGGEARMLEIRGDAIGRVQIQADAQTISYAVETYSSEVGVIENLLPPVTASH